MQIEGFDPLANAWKTKISSRSFGSIFSLKRDIAGSFLLFFFIWGYIYHARCHTEDLKLLEMLTKAQTIIRVMFLRPITLLQKILVQI